MKKLLIVIVFLLVLTPLFADKGIVIREDVCGMGNAIILTTDGWYIAAVHNSGVYLNEGDIVTGKMTKYGFQTLYTEDGREGRFYIKDYEIYFDDADDEFPDGAGWPDPELFPIVSE